MMGPNVNNGPGGPRQGNPFNNPFNFNNGANRGQGPFNGIFNPLQSLDNALKGKNSAGIWTLVISNSSATDSGTLNSWSLSFDETQLGTGLGEPSKFVYSGRRTIIIEVPFTLTDVPLR